MGDDSSLVGFGYVLTLSTIALVLGFVGSRKQLAKNNAQRQEIATPAPPAHTQEMADEMAALQQQCLRLREQLQQQKTQLTADFQEATFEQIQTLLTNYPSAQKMAQAKPDLPAKNLIALFIPLENLLQGWGVELIGSAWEQVAYDPQIHQPDEDDVTVGEQVYVRFVGYRQGDRILCPAKVSRTLPGGAQ
ncbi:molecular chaperone GrpE [Leptolyngbya sp. FACHB-671]|uniref:nucleotide exchange factor GrpE n=1 Tax=Leptolyngbya sp. FACHB-671 TaxID=2692812 RepID=UPI001688FAF9|nr:molecular chaperone GrpE [Leptolyngbya sp. FACHB-671]MBD2066839.1 molecular chaperone GrpE [Leptolyngbya sp. FACHB-671]